MDKGAGCVWQEWDSLQALQLTQTSMCHDWSLPAICVGMQPVALGMQAASAPEVAAWLAECKHSLSGPCPSSTHLQVAAKKLDRRLATLGANPLLERGLGDDQVIHTRLCGSRQFRLPLLK
jgi:hypothetical protein